MCGTDTHMQQMKNMCVCVILSRRYRPCRTQGRRTDGEPRNGTEKVSMMDARAAHVTLIPDSPEPPHADVVWADGYFSIHKSGNCLGTREFPSVWQLLCCVSQWQQVFLGLSRFEKQDFSGLSAFVTVLDRARCRIVPFVHGRPGTSYTLQNKPTAS